MRCEILELESLHSRMQYSEATAAASCALVHNAPVKLQVSELLIVFIAAGDAFHLLYQGLADPALLEYKPSLTAAAMLASCRCAAGIVPFWPATLESLTGYREQHAADFGSAMSAVGNLMTIVYTSADLHPHHSY